MMPLTMKMVPRRYIPPPIHDFQFTIAISTIRKSEIVNDSGLSGGLVELLLVLRGAFDQHVVGQERTLGRVVVADRHDANRLLEVGRLRLGVDDLDHLPSAILHAERKVAVGVVAAKIGRIEEACEL